MAKEKPFGMVEHEGNGIILIGSTGSRVTVDQAKQLIDGLEEAIQEAESEKNDHPVQ